MAPKGKYFVITSKQTGLALDVKGGSANPGTPVVMWGKHGNNNQQWFIDPVTGTIRSRANAALVLTINGANRLVIDHHRPGDANQTWLSNKHRDAIENRSNTNRVFDVVGASTAQGAEVCAWDFHGRDNQKWKLDFQPRRYFFIKSELSGKVLDVEGGNARPGARIIVWGQKGGQADNQLWFEDMYGNIRSKLNDAVVLDGTSGTLHLGSYDANVPRTYWAVHDNRIVNVFNQSECLDIKGNNAGDGAEICIWSYKGSSNQHWKFDYIN